MLILLQDLGSDKMMNTKQKSGILSKNISNQINREKRIRRFFSLKKDYTKRKTEMRNQWKCGYDPSQRHSWPSGARDSHRPEVNDCHRPSRRRLLCRRQRSRVLACRADDRPCVGSNWKWICDLRACFPIDSN